MVALANFVMETTTAPYNNLTINLNGAYLNGQTFIAAYGSGTTTFYFLDDGTQAEWGIGVVTAGTPNTLTRTTVLGNTAGTQPVRLQFGGLTKVYSEIPGGRIAQLNTGGSMSLLLGQQGGELDVTVWSDLDYRILGVVGIASQASATIQVPTGYLSLRVEGRGIMPSVATGIAATVTRSGSVVTAYNYGLTELISGGVANASSGSTTGGAMPLVAEQVQAASGLDFDFDVSVATGLASWSSVGSRNTNPAIIRTLGMSNNCSPLTAFTITPGAGGTLTSGSLRLLGRK